METLSLTAIKICNILISLLTIYRRIYIQAVIRKLKA